jgi:hypothetical protein
MALQVIALDILHEFFLDQVGDKVELAEGFEKYGESIGGPLQVGDRGVVVEAQRGPNGEKYVPWNLSSRC